MSPTSKHTLTYAERGGLPLEADVHLPSSFKKSGAPLRALLWIHTGGFLQGTREFIPPHLLQAAESHGLAIVSPDFRLCPQVNILEALLDVHAAAEWILSGKLQEALAPLGEDRKIDTESWILGGNSAGGWAALLLGLDLLSASTSPKTSSVPTLSRLPHAVFAIYPITTVSSDEAPFYCSPLRPLPWAFRAGAVPHQDLIEADEMAPFTDRLRVPMTTASPAAQPIRAMLYSYARQQGTYASLLLPSDGSFAEDDISTPKLVRKRWGADRRRSAAGPAPPTVFIAHGESDIMVPWSQSRLVADALASTGLRYRFDLIDGEAPHLYDMAETRKLDGLYEFILGDSPAPTGGCAKHQLVVGTFNTPELFSIAFDAVQGRLSLASTSKALGNHSWLSFGPVGANEGRQEPKSLYATAWTDPPTVAAYRIGSAEDGSTRFELLGTARTRARSGYVAVGSDALYTCGGPTGEVYALDSEKGGFVASEAPLQLLEFLDGGIVDGAAGIDVVNQSIGVGVHSALSRDRGTASDSTVAPGDFGGLRHGSHSFDLSPDGSLAYVADIGRNCIWVYAVSPSGGRLQLVDKKVAPRANDGPRHVWPHPKGKVVYCLQEHSCVVDVFEVVRGESAPGKPKLEWRQGVRIIPAQEDEKLYWADEVRTSAALADEGEAYAPRFLWASTRGLKDETRGWLALFALDEEGFVVDSSNALIKADEGPLSPHQSAWLDLVQTPTSGGWANAVSPSPRRILGQEVAALTCSARGLVMVYKVQEPEAGTVGKPSLHLVDSLDLGTTEAGATRGAATALWFR